MWCPSCGDEFREGVVRCPDCGLELVSDEVVPRATEPAKPEIPDGYELLEGNLDASAQDFIEWIDEEGIQSVLVAREPETMEVWVPKESMPRAQELLAEYHEDEFEELAIEFEPEDLSVRSQELLQEGDLDTFSSLVAGREEDILQLADRLEEAGIPVLVVEIEDVDEWEIHIPDRCTSAAEPLLG